MTRASLTLAACALVASAGCATESATPAGDSAAAALAADSAAMPAAAPALPNPDSTPAARAAGGFRDTLDPLPPRGDRTPRSRPDTLMPPGTIGRDRALPFDVNDPKRQLPANPPATKTPE